MHEGISRNANAAVYNDIDDRTEQRRIPLAAIAVDLLAFTALSGLAVWVPPLNEPDQVTVKR